MSYKATTWAYQQPVTGSKKFVLVVLADMADEAMSCRPGQQLLASTTGLSLKTIERALASLEELGLVTRTRLSNTSGGQPVYRYRLHADQ